MKKIVATAFVSAFVLMQAGAAVAETRVYIGGPDGRARVEERHSGWGRNDGPHRHNPPPRVVVRERKGLNDFEAGMLGFLGGFAAGSALDNGGRIPVVKQRPDRFERPRQLLKPWSAPWYRWCSARYRSFDPRTGTYRDFNGTVRFCEARR